MRANNCFNCKHSQEIQYFDKANNKLANYKDVVFCFNQPKINDLLERSGPQVLYPTVADVTDKCKFFEVNDE